MEPKGLRRAQRNDRSGDVAAAFARLLLHLGRFEPIRTIEAIAASIANQVERVSSQPAAGSLPSDDAVRARQECFAQYLVALTTQFGTSGSAAEEDVAYASCLRIARRAMAAAISDPTGKATRFHPIDEAPQWARGLLPCASIGGFLFYRDDHSLLAPETAEGR